MGLSNRRNALGGGGSYRFDPLQKGSRNMKTLTPYEHLVQAVTDCLEFLEEARPRGSSKHVARLRRSLKISRIDSTMWSSLEDLSREVLRMQLETNVLGWHQLSAAVLPAMRAAGQGRIIQNSSLLGFIALRYRGAYVTSKYAIEGWSDTLRLELAGTGIHVSVIEPGPVTSRFRENARTAFRLYVDVPSSPHRDDYRAVEERLRSTARVPFELPPEAVLAKVVHALESARPKPRYHVTVPTHAFALLRRLLPQRAMHALLAWVSGRENRS